jgi:ribonuclease Y
MEDWIWYVVIAAGVAGVGVLLVYYFNKQRQLVQKEMELVQREREHARAEIEAKRREVMLEARDEAHRVRAEVEKENKERRLEIDRVEKRLAQREEAVDRRGQTLDKREGDITAREERVKQTAADVERTLQRQAEELERISGLSRQDAKALFLRMVEDESRFEASKIVREIEAEAKKVGDKKARNIVALAVQKCAVDHVSESTVSVVPLPNDEMKGRIIGREGRNIRAFETVTGVDLIIDDTPEAVVLSAFDPVRREIARIALSNLIGDGRIHPARIEETVGKARREVDAAIAEAGERAVLETGVTGLDPEIVKLLGRLRYRTSYGQNVLEHSVEVTHLAGVMAAELGVNVVLAKRAALLHDIGKAVDFEVEGSHDRIGVDLAKRYRESGDVIHAIEAHHGLCDPRTVEAVLVAAADALSAARPGARRESLETYVRRLEALERIADSFPGVEKTYAVQAGREVRVIVKPEEVDDLGAHRLARDTAKRIEEELQYPGQIKVTVIRETRASEIAK